MNHLDLFIIVISISILLWHIDDISGNSVLEAWCQVSSQLNKFSKYPCRVNERFLVVFSFDINPRSLKSYFSFIGSVPSSAIPTRISSTYMSLSFNSQNRFCYFFNVCSFFGATSFILWNNKINDLVRLRFPIKMCSKMSIGDSKLPWLPRISDLKKKSTLYTWPKSPRYLPLMNRYVHCIKSKCAND